MDIYNLTGHIINIDNKEIPSHGSIRLSQINKEVLPIETNLGEIPIGVTEYYGAILPEETDDKIIIVSNIVAQSYPERRDLYIPWGVSGKYGDRKCRGLQRNPYFKP